MYPTGPQPNYPLLFSTVKDFTAKTMGSLVSPIVTNLHKTRNDFQPTLLFHFKSTNTKHVEINVP